MKTTGAFWHSASASPSYHPCSVSLVRHDFPTGSSGERLENPGINSDSHAAHRSVREKKLTGARVRREEVVWIHRAVIKRVRTSLGQRLRRRVAHRRAGGRG